MDDERDDIELAELLAEVRRIDVMASRLVTQIMAGEYSSVFRGAGLEFETVREYEEGDDIRSVDWNVTARVGRPFVKTYVEEREQSVVFLLDLSGSMSAGYGFWSARQAAARVCACLALSAIRNNDKVGLVAFSGDVDRFVPPAKGVGHVLRIVRDCLALRGTSRGTDLTRALEYAIRVLKKHSILFVVSDFLAEGWRKTLTLSARRHDVIAVRLIPPELRDGPGRGVLRLEDPETGRDLLVDGRSERVRAEFAARATAFLDRTTEDLRRAGADVMDVPITLDRDPELVARPILKFFRMRERRGRKR